MPKAKLSKNVQKALEICRKTAQHIGLPINIVDAEYIPDEKKIVFNFSSEERVDFRELVKELKKKIRVKIELHQLGPRDNALKMGWLPPCGLKEVCCKMKGKYPSVSKKMLEVQGIKPSQKVFGCCGKLKCCYSHEYLNEKYTTETYPKPCGAGIFTDTNVSSAIVDNTQRKNSYE